MAPSVGKMRFDDAESTLGVWRNFGCVLLHPEHHHAAIQDRDHQMGFQCGSLPF
jgi:hypothetical protein